MRSKINGFVVELTPKEFLELTKLRDTIDIPVMSMTDTVKQSQILRKRLQEDPNYDPYGGVVASKEQLSEQVKRPIARSEEIPYIGDLDTGIHETF